MEKIIKKLKQCSPNGFGEPSITLSHIILSQSECQQILTALEGPSEGEMINEAIILSKAASYRTYGSVFKEAFIIGVYWCKLWKGVNGSVFKEAFIIGVYWCKLWKGVKG